MKNILKQGLILLLFGVIWYAAFWGTTLIIYPDIFEKGAINASRADRSIFRVDYRYVIMNLDRVLEPDRKKIIVLGASNARMGFQPVDLATYFSDYAISNLAVGGANISEVLDLVKIMECSPSPGYDKTIFILGIWYASFFEDGRLFPKGDSPVAKEALTSGLYKRTKDGFEPGMGYDNFRIKTEFLRPYLFMKGYFYMAQRTTFNLMDNFIENIRAFKQGEPFRLKELAPNKKIKVNERYKNKAMKYWDDIMKKEDVSVGGEQFGVLLDLCKRISAMGAKLVIVDLPVPEWHMKRSGFFKEYQANKMRYLEKAVLLKGVWYCDLQELSDSDMFSDSAHPTYAIQKKWSEGLAKYILKNGIEHN